MCIRDRVYLIEVNFYSGGGSKLNEVARSYSDIAPKINSVKGFESVSYTHLVSASGVNEKACLPSVFASLSARFATVLFRSKSNGQNVPAEGG